jgi:hypothetical protein
MSEAKDDNIRLHACEECGLHYSSEEMKKKCRAWCAENKSCNLEITKYSEESNKLALEMR